MNKKHFKESMLKNLILLLSLPIVLSTGTAIAQERIRMFDEVKSEHAIIRDIDGNQRLVYNWGYDHTYFIKASDTDGSYPALGIPREIVVNDFIIHDGMVYFCGSKAEAFSDTVAVLGWFNLEGFPASNVYYFKNESMKAFEKVGVYTIHADQDELHAVMIAKLIDDTYTLVDVNPYGNNHYNINILDMPTELKKHNIDDLIVTDNFAVISSHTKDFYLPTGHLWCFTKPNSPGYSIFSVNVQHCKLGFASSGKISLVNLGKTNEYVNDYIVLHAGNKVETQTNYISRFNGPVHISTYSTTYHNIDSPWMDIHLMGSFDPDDMFMDVLVNDGRMMLSAPMKRSIFRFELTQWGNSPYIYMDGVQPDKENIQSLTYLQGQHRFEAAGHWNTDPDVLRLYNYQFLWNGPCMKQQASSATFTNKQYMFIPEKCSGIKTDASRLPLSRISTSFLISTICGDQQ